MFNLNSKQLVLLTLTSVSAYFLYAVSDVLFPFFFGGILAYFFHPLITRLQERKIPRGVSAFLVTLVMVTIITVALIWIVPKLYTQLMTFLGVLPSYMKKVRTLLTAYMGKLEARLPAEYMLVLREKVTQLSDYLFNSTIYGFRGMLNHSISLIHTVTLIIVAPVIAYYLMRDWPKLTKNIEKWLPLSYRNVLTSGLERVNDALSSFIRGQGLVSLSLGVFYITSFSIIGINYSIFLGALSGLLAFVPYVGITISFFSALLVVYFQDGGTYLYVATILTFACGQFIELTFLAPQLIGRKLGLHPIWVLFAIFAGGYMFGFWGVLLATPIAGVIRSLLPALLAYVMRAK